jgi:hypothetical protein
MIELNFSTVEDLVFRDQAAQRALPIHMFGIFEQWRMSKRLPYLKDLGKQAVLIFLSNLNQEDIEALERYFGDRINVEKLNYSVALNYKIPLAEVCDTLCELVGFANLTTWRDDEFLYVSCWR